MSQQNNNIYITFLNVNGNNKGSILSNKEFMICLCEINIDIIKTKTKKIIGCYINPNDLILDNNIDKNIFYFQMYKPLTYFFNINNLLKSTLYSKNYTNHITKKILKENPDISIRKIITKCEETLKEKILIR